MENPDLVFQETGDSSLTYSRWLNVIADKLSNLTQTRQSRQNGPFCQSFSKQYASGGTSPKWACFCYLAQQQTVSTCITGARSPNMDNDTISLPWEDLDPCAFPLIAILGKWWRSCRTTHAGESLRLLQSGPTCLVLGSCQVRFLGTCPTCSLNHLIRLLTGICQN